MPNHHKKRNSKDKLQPTKTTQLTGQAYIRLGPEAKQGIFYKLPSNGENVKMAKHPI